MSVQINLTSSRIGSNPGGKCIFKSNRLEFGAYFKYCIGSRMKGHSVFVPENQPVYEAITFELAKKIGLDVVDSYVLLNKNQDVVFEGWRDVDESDPSGRKYYFVSRLSRKPTAEELRNDNGEVPKLHHVYLDSLLIADIVGRKQNYSIDPNNPKHITYLDLGCSFVYAHGGIIEQPNKLRLKDPKEIKKERKKLKGKSIIDVTNSEIINLEDFIESTSNLSITTLNPWKQARVSDLISQEEISEIKGELIHSFSSCLSDFKERGLLISE